MAGSCFLLKGGRAAPVPEWAPAARTAIAGRRFAQAWFAESRAEGIAQGRTEGLRRGIEQGTQRGLEQQRALLIRQVATKFGAGASVRVRPVLARIADPGLLAEVADGLLVSATETELVVRIEAVAAVTSAGPDAASQGTVS